MERPTVGCGSPVPLVGLGVQSMPSNTLDTTSCVDCTRHPLASWETLEALVEAFQARVGDGPVYVFLDEIQGIEGWERWLRSRLDRPSGVHFVITGSNGALLSGELGSALTGRHVTVELFPFDWAELRARDPDLPLTAYLERGGFPEPTALGEDGDGLLRQYLHDIVERDVRERLRARSSRALLQVVKLAYDAAGSELSARKGWVPEHVAKRAAAREDRMALRADAQLADQDAVTVAADCVVVEVVPADSVKPRGMPKATP